MQSPSGKPAIPSEGPPDSPILLIGESPAEAEMAKGRPFVGRSGWVLNSLLKEAGIDRASCRVTNLVPVRAPQDKYLLHTDEDKHWGYWLLEQEIARFLKHGGKAIVPLGENPLSAIVPSLPQPPRWLEAGERTAEKKAGRIGAWRGSLLPYGKRITTLADYEEIIKPFSGPAVIPSYHPAAVAKLYSLHLLSLVDFGKVRTWVDGKWEFPKQREWHFQDLAALEKFVESVLAKGHFVSVDTEMNPPIIGLSDDWECHVWTWTPVLLPLLRKLMASPQVLKVAHNAGHDWTQLRQWGVDVLPPECDTGGVAAALNNAFPRNLSPALATRFTTWPYHKWLVGENPQVYCGYDTLVAADAYWQARVNEAQPKGLGPIIDHDHRLFRGLLEMQWRGVRIDEAARQAAAEEARSQFKEAEAELTAIAEPIIKERLGAFTKPHLFREDRQCTCCGGGKNSRVHCWRCGGLSQKPKKKEDYFDAYEELWSAEGVPGDEIAKAFKKERVQELMEALPSCYTCASTGKTSHWLPFNVESEDQLKDVLYRGLKIPPRRYKGKETTRASQLEPLAGKHPFIDAALRVSAAKADYVTLDRLEPDLDGRVHSVFDPWGTSTFRTASSEGLLQKGSNVQNVPKEHRYIFVADPGFLLLAPDKAQIQTRVVAVLSKDPNLLAAFTTPIHWPENPKHGQIDSHTFVQQKLDGMGIVLRRDSCKRIVYAWLFGVIGDQLEIEVNAECSQKGWPERLKKGEGAKVLAALATIFPKVSEWRANVAQELLATRAIVSPTGHRRVWAGYITERVKGATGEWKQQLSHSVAKEGWATNPQEVEAYVLAKGLENIRKHAADLLTPYLHIHDELVLQASADRIPEAIVAIKEHMDIILWGMPFPTDVGEAANNWRCAKGSHDYRGGTCRFCGRVK